ncbi:MAG: hypothetical protein M3P51_04070, partial [Chloroflexota bacterium]|nr:hypothetical protein [Chloroflexota bacterium]
MSQDRETGLLKDPARLRYVVEHYDELQGLRHATAGVALTVWGILQTPWNSEASLFPLLLMLLIPGSWWLEYRLRKYYEQRYGYVKERRDGWSELVLTVLVLA